MKAAERKSWSPTTPLLVSKAVTSPKRHWTVFCVGRVAVSVLMRLWRLQSVVLLLLLLGTFSSAQRGLQADQATVSSPSFLPLPRNHRICFHTSDENKLNYRLMHTPAYKWGKFNLRMAGLFGVVFDLILLSMWKLQYDLVSDSTRSGRGPRFLGPNQYCLPSYPPTMRRDCC